MAAAALRDALGARIQRRPSGRAVVRGPARPVSRRFSRRECECREHGCARARLYSRHASRAGSAVYQALLCPPLCQQHQPPDEGHPLRRSGAAEPRVSRKGGRGRADDQSHLRRGRLRGGHAEIHHRDLRYRRGACRLYGDAARVRLAARAAQFAFYAGVLCMRRADEKAGAARGRGV